MKEMKSIPYGIAGFEDVLRGNCYYADKTMYLPLLETTGNYLFLIRPRRFGKSLFVSMMQCYYDRAMAGSFDTLFDGLWIHQHPTALKNAFQVVYLDFSMVGGKDVEELQDNFNHYIGTRLDLFADKYGRDYAPGFADAVKRCPSPRNKLVYIQGQAQLKGHRLYLIIDEYDYFTNVILSKQGLETFKALTHAYGFYRDYFKIFKAMFSRVFLTGVSPVTLDDLTSGYNIDWNISQDPRFNAMLGFSDSEVRTMFHYYQQHGGIAGDTDIDATIEEMRPWYNNYCFSEDSLADERVFNSDMVLYYLRHLVLYGRKPREMVDKNIRTDYSKLRMLAEIDRGRERDKRMAVIEQISSTGELNMTLKTSFPADKTADESNFCSLIYYYGMLTMGGMRGQRIRMVVPNHCVREQLWSFMRSYYDSLHKPDTRKLFDEMDEMAFSGNWKPLIEDIATAYRESSSVRESILGEHNLQGFFKAWFDLNSYYLTWPEHELNYGYADFLLIPDHVRYPDVRHAYIMELKYLKSTAGNEELHAREAEAEQQLRRYASDKKLIRQCGSTQLHLLKVLFRGPAMAVCEEI